MPNITKEKIIFISNQCSDGVITVEEYQQHLIALLIDANFKDLDSLNFLISHLSFT